MDVIIKNGVNAPELAVSKTGWLMRGIGAGLLPLAVVVMLPFLGYITPSDPAFPKPAFFIVGLVLSIIAIGLLLRRAGVVISRTKGSVSDWWGIVFPWQKKSYNLEDYKHLVMRYEPLGNQTIRRNGRPAYVYRVKLESADARRYVVLAEAFRKDTAMKLGQRAASYLGKPMREICS